MRIAIVLLMFTALAGCGANEQVLKSGRETPTPVEQHPAEAPRSAFEEDVESLRTADFRFIWIMRRRDGSPMTKEDRALAKANTVDMNRRVLTDSDKAILIGTNNLPPKANLDALYKAFAIEDLSREPIAQAVAVSNSNANK